MQRYSHQVIRVVQAITLMGSVGGGMYGYNESKTIDDKYIKSLYITGFAGLGFVGLGFVTALTRELGDHGTNRLANFGSDHLDGGASFVGLHNFGGQFFGVRHNSNSFLSHHMSFQSGFCAV